MPQPGSYLKSLKILHTALLAGQAAFLLIVIFLKQVRAMSAPAASLDKALQVAAVAIAFVACFFATKTFKNKLLAIRDAEKLEDKTEQYRAASIIQWATLEAPSLFSIICFFLTGNYAFVALAVALILFFALQMPSRLKTMLHLQLSEEEVDSLQ
ncbi:MAG: hypothetical protein QM726_26390 [Chitinophagaceae bacterium]